MQGSLKITEAWTNINSLEFRNINEGSQSLGAASGDTLKFYNMPSLVSPRVQLWQGAEPTLETSEGAIQLRGDVIMGVGADPVWVRCDSGEHRFTVELIKA